MASPTKRTPRKAAPQKKWTEEHLLTSEKSVLVGADLVKLLASSAAWSCLEEDEKRQILALLPENTHPITESSSENPKKIIPPLPDSFVRYSNNWRDGIRQFQLDLQNGRYDPEWLCQAEEARDKRANGDFDSFKNDEFEEFWGQKQKVDMNLACGESGRVKLRDLIADGVILMGDVWRFQFVFGKGDERIFIDKEVTVHKIHPAKLTFIIPTGQRVFLPSGSAIVQATEPQTQESGNRNGDVNESTKQEGNEEEGKLSPKLDDDTYLGITKEIATTGIKKETIAPTQENCPEPKEKQICLTGEASSNDNDNVQVVVMSSHSAIQSVPDVVLKRLVPQSTSEPSPKRKRGRPRKHQPTPELSQDVDASDVSGEALQQKLFKSESVELEIEVQVQQPKSLDHNFTNDITNAPEQSEPEIPTNHHTITQSPTFHETEMDIDTTNDSTALTTESQINLIKPSPQPTFSGPAAIIVTVVSPNSLVKEILKTDGRRPDGRSANAWKEIRCFRNNQDMGSLFDVRHTWYLQQQK
ncbi:hypothetical protein N7495_007704 [Penicillium taxi]|uniref:uncharacterized protein n=1 Tax=Penicillium taxi TaxID=168475 RepID=UPI0025451B38|nr:uncharacterized protein N7495_007704 [Penicillium taxi]KAJ5887663.1 hypothetical protein N7495_007704 [Penicillium taxi]